MNIKSVAILGAGAVGAYMLWGLSTHESIDLCLVADGERKERLERNGLIINDELFRPTVKTPSEAKGVDLLLITVKYTSLKDSLDDIEKIVDKNTIVMSILNGVDSEDIIAERIGMDRIVHSLIKVASERKGNVTKFDPVATIGFIYGEKDLSRGTERIEALNKLFSECRVKYRSTDVIESEIWSKFRLNVANNQPQAMIGCGTGAYRDSEHLAFIQRKLGEEVDAVATALGIDISLSDRSSAKGSRVSDRARYSTLQDLDAGRHTEVDMFAGAMVRMGAKLGIPTPFNEMTYHIIKALEEKNDGKFDYE